MGLTKNNPGGEIANGLWSGEDKDSVCFACTVLAALAISGSGFLYSAGSICSYPQAGCSWEPDNLSFMLFPLTVSLHIKDVSQAAQICVKSLDCICCHVKRHCTHCP